MGWIKPKTKIWFYDKAFHLVTGCEKHPQYRALKKPTAECRRCRELFKIASDLEAQGYLKRKE